MSNVTSSGTSPPCEWHPAAGGRAGGLAGWLVLPPLLLPAAALVPHHSHTAIQQQVHTAIQQRVHITALVLSALLALICRVLSDKDNATRHAVWEELQLRRTAGASGGSIGALGPLLPELAQLQWLEDIELNIYSQTLYASIPAEWGMPDAFPRLKR